MNPRTVTSWDLSRYGTMLTVYWSEPGSDDLFVAHLKNDTALEPWQVAGLVAAVRAGAPVEELRLPEAKPLRGLLYRSLEKVADALFEAADRLTVGHPMAGEAR